MRKILGSRKKYYSQTNNAQVELFGDYFNNRKMIACGPTSAAMGFDIAGWPMQIFTPGEQPEDSILMIAHNPKNLELLKKRRNINYNKFPPNEVPQIYDVIGELLYREYIGSNKRIKACQFRWNLDFDIIKNNINNGIPMMICGDFPCGGHYVLIVGYDDDRNVIIFNDPYPLQWSNKNGYNREMKINFLRKNIHKWRIDFFPSFLFKS